MSYRANVSPVLAICNAVNIPSSDRINTHADMSFKHCSSSNSLPTHLIIGVEDDVSSLVSWTHFDRASTESVKIYFE